MPDASGGDGLARKAAEKKPEEVARRWQEEIKLARKSRSKWLQKAKKIVRRYRDEPDSGGDSKESGDAARMNVLWSNVQTLLPAVFARIPKPVVERRFLDRDPVGRAASMILERTLKHLVGGGYFQESMRS